MATDKNKTPQLSANKMSSSLRERLKRSRRSFYSPNSSSHQISRIHSTVPDSDKDRPSTSTTLRLECESKDSEAINEPEVSDEIILHKFGRTIAEENTGKVTAGIAKHEQGGTDVQGCGQMDVNQQGQGQDITRQSQAQDIDRQYQGQVDISQHDQDQAIDRQGQYHADISQQAQGEDDIDRQGQSHLDIDKQGQCHGGIDNLNQLLQMRQDLNESLAIKEETLRKLKMVKMYRNKNDLERLQQLITKWRTASQDILLELQEKLPMEKKPRLGELIKSWQLDPDLLQFDGDVDSFRE
ncbi:uncharacterized protein LOC144446737 [Glandiceps talaboti]